MIYFIWPFLLTLVFLYKTEGSVTFAAVTSNTRSWDRWLHLFQAIRIQIDHHHSGRNCLLKTKQNEKNGVLELS